jgi:hypothetical protein
MADTDSPPVTPAARLSFLRFYRAIKVWGPPERLPSNGGRKSVARLILTTVILAIAASYLSERRRASRARIQARQAVERWEGEGGAVPPSGKVRG